jgi:hypothetical protein
MRFYKGNEGVIKPFKLVKNDKTTAVDLTNLTVTWTWIDRDGNQPTGSPITGNVTDAVNGLVEFSIPATVLSTVGKYRSFINASGIGYNEDFKPINVQVVKGSDG